MSILSGALNMGRSHAAMRFTETFDTFIVISDLNDDGIHVDTETVVHEDVPGQVKYPTLTVSEREQGAQVPAAQDIVIKVAVGATPDVVVNTRWRCTASTADPSLVGRVFRTKGEPQSGQVTAHRYPVERVS